MGIQTPCVGVGNMKGDPHPLSWVELNRISWEFPHVSGSQSAASVPGTSALPRNVLEQNVFRFFPDLRSQTLGAASRNLGVNKPPRQFRCTRKFENHCPGPVVLIWRQFCGDFWRHVGCHTWSVECYWRVVVEIRTTHRWPPQESNVLPEMSTVPHLKPHEAEQAPLMGLQPPGSPQWIGLFESLLGTGLAHLRHSQSKRD